MALFGKPAVWRGEFGRCAPVWNVQRQQWGVVLSDYEFDADVAIEDGAQVATWALADLVLLGQCRLCNALVLDDGRNRVAVDRATGCLHRGRVRE